MGLAAAIPVVTMILPPGISLIRFIPYSYTADIYRGKFKPHNKLVDYVTFVAFFPQLVAGPIARASDLLPQIAAKRPAISWVQAEDAVWLICWGLFKKIALADNFGSLVELIEARIQPDNTSSGRASCSPMRSLGRFTAISPPIRTSLVVSPSSSISS